MRFLTVLVLILGAFAMPGSSRADTAQDDAALAWRATRAAALEVVLATARAFDPLFQNAYTTEVGDGSAEVVLRGTPFTDRDGKPSHPALLVSPFETTGVVLTPIDYAAGIPDLSLDSLSSGLFKAVIAAMDKRFERIP